MQQLDLHRVRHAEAPEKVRKFLNYAELPSRIVTGRSKKMREIVEKVATEYGYHCYFESSLNFGALIVNDISSNI